MQDAKDAKTDIANEDGVGKLSFSGSSGEIKYDLSLPLLKEIDVQASQVSVTPRNIFLIIAKVRRAVERISHALLSQVLLRAACVCEIGGEGALGSAHEGVREGHLAACQVSCMREI